MEEIENSIYGGVRFSVGCATEDEATCMGYQSLTSFARRSDAAEAWNARRHAQRPLSASELLDQLLSRIDFDGMDPNTFTIAELRRAI